MLAQALRPIGDGRPVEPADLLRFQVVVPSSGGIDVSSRRLHRDLSCLRVIEGLVLAALFACGPSRVLAQAGDVIFASGFEPPAPAHLIVHYPAGSHFIAARGDGGGLSMTQGVALARSGDTFTLALQIDAPVNWKLVLDDVTYAIGPNYTVAPAQTVEIWPRFTQVTGQVITLIGAFQSTLLGNVRPIYAYLPPTYLENTLARLPVVYINDGQNLWASHPEWAIGGITWQVDTAFDVGAGNGSIAEAIVIGVASTANRIYEYTPTSDPNFGPSGGADLYLRMLAEELKPVVDGALRTRPEAASTSIAGSSLGGLLAAYAGRARPTVFGRVAAPSPASWWDNAVVVGLVLATPPAPNRPLRVYVDSGDAGASFDNVTTTNALAAAYATAGYVEGIDLHHVVQPGGQPNETYWAQRFPGAMQFLLGPRQ